MWLLYRYHSEQKEDDQEYVMNSILWRLYHDETIGDRRSIEVFPGITYDRKGKEKLSWSWMWRIFRYERNEEGRKFYLFFFPITLSDGEPDGA